MEININHSQFENKLIILNRKFVEETFGKFGAQSFSDDPTIL